MGGAASGEFLQLNFLLASLPAMHKPQPGRQA